MVKKKVGKDISFFDYYDMDITGNRSLIKQISRSICHTLVINLITTKGCTDFLVSGNLKKFRSKCRKVPKNYNYKLERYCWASD